MSDYTYEPTRNESLIVSNTSAVIAVGTNGEKKRKAIIIRNIADDVSKIITLNIGSALAVANKGIVIRQGESYYEATDVSLECWQGEITAICAATSATATLSVFER